MRETETDIIEIKSQFLNEAKYSPTLLNDLAEMETYIAESYQGRSLIELLQNADDCNSTKFYIKKLDDNLFLVANNGRIFDKDDLISLCRSGASTKRRRAGTIGFRGIGFKSVVNYANDVYLYSGNYYIHFSKILTKNELDDNIKVPLIRIPHVDEEKKYITEFNEIKSANYTTMFIFETRNEAIINEILEFNNNCLLFLKNIKEIKFEYGENKKINIERDKNLIYKINDGTVCTEWIVLKDNDENYSSIAFKISDGKATRLDGSVIYSFMPTTEKSNMPFIINGDFSTDPSRTKIIDDDETEKTIDSIVSLLSKTIKNLIVNEYDKFGLINIIALYKKDDYNFIYSNTIQTKIYEKYISTLSNELNLLKELSKIKVQPNWIEETDFIEFCNNKNYYTIFTSGNKSIIGVEYILEQIKEITFNIEEFLIFLSNYKATENTRINTIITIINKYRYSLHEDVAQLILNAYLFSYEDIIYKTSDLVNKSITNDKFYKKIEENINDLNDLKSFLSKLGFKDDNFNIDFKSNNYYFNNSNNNNLNNLKHILSDKTIDNTEAPTLKFNKNSNPRKWRSVEENVKIIFEKFDDVKSVFDVTGNNLGYDLIIEYEDGKRKFVEVKSVESLGDAFAMTNNEYATAKSPDFGKDYILTIVEQNSEEIKLSIIDNEQFNKINFIKRIVKYEWAVNSAYSGKYLTFKLEQ